MFSTNIPTPMQMQTPDIGAQIIRNYSGLQQALGQQIKNRLARPLAEAQMRQMGAQTGLTQARVPLTQAQTSKLEEATRLMPRTVDISQANALLKAAAIGQSQSRFNNPTYIASRWMGAQPTPLKLAYNAENSKAFTDVTQHALSNVLNPAAPPATSPAVISALSLLGQSPGEPPQTSGAQNALPTQATSASPPPTEAPVAASQQPLFSANTAQAVQEASKNALIAATTPNAIRTQRAYSAIAGHIYNYGNQFIPSVASYSTFGGSFNRLMQVAQSATGQGADQQYTDLLKFKQVVPVLANEIRRQLGGQATDSEKHTMEALTLPSLWDKTPQQVISLWNNLGHLINITGTALKLSQAQLLERSGTEANISGETPFKARTNFTSKEDFNGYIKGLTPSQRQQARNQLGFK